MALRDRSLGAICSVSDTDIIHPNPQTEANQQNAGKSPGKILDVINPVHFTSPENIAKKKTHCIKKQQNQKKKKPQKISKVKKISRKALTYSSSSDEQELNVEYQESGDLEESSETECVGCGEHKKKTHCLKKQQHQKKKKPQKISKVKKISRKALTYSSSSDEQELNVEYRESGDSEESSETECVGCREQYNLTHSKVDEPSHP
ncbi:hypothetical protein ILUMI_07693 [Ignelater luminosus]|uniref:Uncharacterized protein n=1 Tax=Ignelater luminosus TaxID=2038154 RepID=A0A8K0DCY1_IGNLU|nr:hypothetical protein ILUMI_07693 [Ignelater luminosus]